MLERDALRLIRRLYTNSLIRRIVDLAFAGEGRFIQELNRDLDALEEEEDDGDIL